MKSRKTHLDVILPVLIALLMMTLDHHDRPFTVRDVKTKIVDSDLIIHREREHLNQILLLLTVWQLYLVSSLAMTRVTANFLVLLAAHCVKTNVSGGVFDFSKDFVSENEYCTWLILSKKKCTFEESARRGRHYQGTTGKICTGGHSSTLFCHWHLHTRASWLLDLRCRRIFYSRPSRLQLHEE